jgi:hypothetical protein
VLWPLSVELRRVERLLSDYLIWIGAPVANPAGQAASNAVDLAARDARVAEMLGRFIEYWRERAPPRG